MSIQVDDKLPEPEPARGPVIGVDLGIKALATVSDGRAIANPKAMHARMKKLQRLSRWHSRTEKSSANRKKAQKKLARMHARIAHVRENAFHQATASLFQSRNHAETQNCSDPDTLPTDMRGLRGLHKDGTILAHPQSEVDQDQRGASISDH